MTANATAGRIIDSKFKPAWWLTNRHLQTIYPALPWSGAPDVRLRNQILELPDGDTTSVDWMADGPALDSGAPILIILHGLEGSSDATYAKTLLGAAADRGWCAGVLHFRDCGDYRNRLPRRYHAGETNDIRFFLEKIRTDGHDAPMAATGFSLGGNVLLKYLGENGASTPLDAAAAICVPLDLHNCADSLSTGFSRLYQYHLLKKMKSAIRRKFNSDTAAFDWHRAMGAVTFADFDDAVTAPLHGFSGKNEYYDRCSSITYLTRIQRPTLILNALDDPFMTAAILPNENRLSSAVSLELSPKGGHVGFISGGSPANPEYYLPTRILDFLESGLGAGTESTRSMPGM